MMMDGKQNIWRAGLLCSSCLAAIQNWMDPSKWHMWCCSGEMCCSVSVTEQEVTQIKHGEGFSHTHTHTLKTCRQKCSVLSVKYLNDLRAKERWHETQRKMDLKLGGGHRDLNPLLVSSLHLPSGRPAVCRSLFLSVSRSKSYCPMRSCPDLTQYFSLLLSGAQDWGEKEKWVYWATMWGEAAKTDGVHVECLYYRVLNFV